MHADGVLVVRLAGPLTSEALGHFKAAIVDLHGPQIRAFVADYSAASVLATIDQLDAILDGDEDDAPAAMPAALIVPKVVLPVFREHARRMAARAIVRRLFTHPASALDWAKRQAALELR